jgi:intracellular multiplication protein IcmV
MNQTKRKAPRSNRTKKLLNRIFHIRFWIDWDRIRSGGSFVKQATKTYFVLEQKAPAKSEAFNEAMARLNLSDADLAQRSRNLLRLSYFMASIACGVFLYTGYHLFFGTFSGVILSIAVTSIAAALAFRYHFWYFQIKQRKLGCSFTEWYNQGLRGKTE